MKGVRVTVVAVCLKVKMTPQNYYARRRKRKRQEVDAELVVKLVTAERESQSCLGTRKLHHMLKGKLAEAGVKMGRDRIFEVLRAKDMLVEPVRSENIHTTNSRHYLPIYGNRIKDLKLSHSNQVWVADLTYLRTLEGFLYLALVTDKYSRKVVGWHCGDTLESIGCLNALEMALETLPPGAHPIHHSDRGSQYCCHEYVNCLMGCGSEVSMTETNHCAENALAERINGILKSEYGLGLTIKTKEQARRMVAQAIWLYNTRRPHTSLKFQVPEAVHSQAM